MNGRYLNRFTSDDSVFPMIFRTLVYPLFRESMRAVNCGSDARITLVLSHYTEIMQRSLSFLLNED